MAINALFAAKTSVEAGVPTLGAPPLFDWLQVLAIWIAVGSDDPVTPVAYSHRMHTGIKGSTLDIFPGRPHRILNFQAKDFTDRALAFLLAHR